MIMNEIPREWLLLILSDEGIYIPRTFLITYANMIPEGQISDDQKMVLMDGPDHGDYWDVWCRVVDEITIEHSLEGPPTRYNLLEVDGDLWAVPVEV